VRGAAHRNPRSREKKAESSRPREFSSLPVLQQGFSPGVSRRHNDGAKAAHCASPQSERSRISAFFARAACSTRRAFFSSRPASSSTARSRTRRCWPGLGSIYRDGMFVRFPSECRREQLGLYGCRRLGPRKSRSSATVSCERGVGGLIVTTSEDRRARRQDHLRKTLTTSDQCRHHPDTASGSRTRDIRSDASADVRGSPPNPATNSRTTSAAVVARMGFETPAPARS